MKTGCGWVIFEILAGAAGVALCVICYLRLDPDTYRNLPKDGNFRKPVYDEANVRTISAISATYMPNPEDSDAVFADDGMYIVERDTSEASLLYGNTSAESNF